MKLMILMYQFEQNVEIQKSLKTQKKVKRQTKIESPEERMMTTKRVKMRRVQRNVKRKLIEVFCFKNISIFFLKLKFLAESAENIEDPRVLAIVIHECGKLRTDINIYHPMVRIHLLDLDQHGRYVNKLHRYIFFNYF